MSIVHAEALLIETDIMTTKDYRAVEIISNNCTCMLSNHTGRRLLITEFSKLAENTGLNVACKCTFKHYSDRRVQKDRRKLDIESLVFNTFRRTQPFGRRLKDELNKLRFDKMLSEMHLVA
ncbi:MAG: hypothetical protein P1P93_09530 [Gammaproteobacteria bacterium]|nr:hypothetical protein [Gammaproteobacteria bacterium]